MHALEDSSVTAGCLMTPGCKMKLHRPYGIYVSAPL